MRNKKSHLKVTPEYAIIGGGGGAGNEDVVWFEVRKVSAIPAGEYTLAVEYPSSRGGHPITVVIGKTASGTSISAAQP